MKRVRADCQVKDYHRSVSRDLPAVLEDYAQDKKCAYFAGTGIPLQGYGDEPLGGSSALLPLMAAWYAAYHIALCMCSAELAYNRPHRHHADSRRGHKRSRWLLGASVDSSRQWMDTAIVS